jgi:hypothetical protein
MHGDYGRCTDVLPAIEKYCWLKSCHVNDTISLEYASIPRSNYETTLFLGRGIHRFIQPHVLPAYSLSHHISCKKEAQKPTL